MGNTMENTPNSELDKIGQELNAYKQREVVLTDRVAKLESTILRLLETMKRSEESFELRSARVLVKVLGNVTHELEHTIETTAEALAQLDRGFDIFVVDGHTVQENSNTILVRKTENGYDYAIASNPDKIINEQTEPFSKWFDAHPDVFGEKTELLVNIIGYTRKPEKKG